LGIKKAVNKESLFDCLFGGSLGKTIELWKEIAHFESF
jgi:hypothetical protein